MFTYLYSIRTILYRLIEKATVQRLKSLPVEVQIFYLSFRRRSSALVYTVGFRIMPSQNLRNIQNIKKQRK